MKYYGNGWLYLIISPLKKLQETKFYTHGSYLLYDPKEYLEIIPCGNNNKVYKTLKKSQICHPATFQHN